MDEDAIAEKIRLPKMTRRLGKIFRDAISQANKSEISTRAASLAFTTVLSIAPLLAVFFYVFKVYGGLEYGYSKLEPFLLENLSEGTGDIVAQHLNTFIHQVHANTLGWAGITGLLLTAVMAYLNITKAFNHIWQISERKKMYHPVIRAITLIVIGPLLLTVSLAITGALSAEIKTIPYSGQIVAFLLSVTLYSMVYTLIPTIRLPFKTIVFGSLLPAFLWEAAKIGYAIYTKRVLTYSTFYGSFAAIPLFLLWIYIGWYITLLGAVWIKALHKTNT